MDTFYLGLACFAGTLLGGLLTIGVGAFIAWLTRPAQPAAVAGLDARPPAQILADHFRPQLVATLRITRREFPAPLRVDLQRAIDDWLAAHAAGSTLQGLYVRYSHLGASFNELIQEGDYVGATLGPPRYDDVDVGGEQPIPCLNNGLWLARAGERPLAILMAFGANLGQAAPPVQVEIAVGSKEDLPLAQEIFTAIETAVRRSETYRGKVLSLEGAAQFSGAVAGFTIHKLGRIERDDLVLPAATLAALERNVIEFTRQREALSARGLSAKKGLLFHGPPGTGKTHTIRYLAGALPGHTVLLATAEQVGEIANYMALARLLQPSVLVLEDVDLIGRNRDQMESVCTEVLLNRLLNEMDGLREDCEVLFLLTTNRPDALENALAARPGRIDQAIEFPLPDAEGRDKLVRLYSRGLELDASLVEAIVERTGGVSAAFLKELMRRAYQYQLAEEDGARLSAAAVEQALDEMLEQGGVLNRRLFNLTGSGSIGFVTPEPRVGSTLGKPRSK